MELGIAIVYLWDFPHIFWGWKSHNQDLNFNDMLDHLSKESYKTFLTSINPGHTFETMIDFKEATNLYRTLSDTVHGKISTHESNLADRFMHNSTDSQRNLQFILRVEDVLLELFRNRFPDGYELMAVKIRQ